MTQDDINELLNEVKRGNKVFPGIYKKVDEIAKNKKEGEWDDLCYVPTEKIMMLLYSSYPKATPQYYAQDAQLIASVANWRRTKQIYSFPAEMRELLYSQDMQDENIPIETLKALPFSCIYIEADDIMADTVGFFVSFDSGINNDRLDLRITGIGKKSTPLFVPLKKGSTIASVVDDVIKGAIETMRSQGYTEENIYKSLDKGFGGIEKFKKKYIDETNKVIQLVLYICSANADVQENPEQKKIYRKRKNVGQQKIRDQLKEVQAHDCGEDISIIIRKMKKNGTYYVYDNDSSQKGKGAPKRPHVRRGHYHHFWKGKRGSENRTLVLNWVAPTFINSSLVEEAETVTVNEER